MTQGQQTPVINWPTPSPITYGTAQLNAAANVPGTFAYTPAAGTVLPTGIHQLQAVFTPSDTTTYKTTTTSVMLQVNQAAPSITWGTPAPITYGTALSTAQLNASASTPGSLPTRRQRAPSSPLVRRCLRSPSRQPIAPITRPPPLRSL